MMSIETKDSGFIALIAVILLATGALTFSLVITGSAVEYSDTVYRRELRVQASLNAESCVSAAALMSGKDIFLSGYVVISELGCSAHIMRLGSSVWVEATSTLSGVSSGKSSGYFIGI